MLALVALFEEKAEYGVAGVCADNWADIGELDFVSGDAGLALQ